MAIFSLVVDVVSSAQVREPVQCRYARHEEVLSAAKHVERFDAADTASYRLLRNREGRPFFLAPDDRVTLAVGPNEIAVVDPLLLQKFDRGHRLGADEQEDGAARHLVICFGQRVRIVRWSIRRAAPYQAMYVDVSQTGEFRVPRVHAPDMASERYLPATRVVRVIEVIVALRVGAERRIVYIRRQRQRGAAAPTAHQFRGDPFPFFLGAAIRPKESIERAHARLILAEAGIGAVSAQYVRLRHRQENPGLARIAKDELAGFDRPTVARPRLNAAALDRRLVDAVFVPERIEIARLCAEVLHGEHADPREALVLLASNGEGAAPIFLGIAECTDADMDLTLAERLLPIPRIVDPIVAKLLCTRGHADAKRLGEALQRLLRKPERLEARIADSDLQPGSRRIPPIRRGSDMRCQPADEFPARSSIVDTQEYMSTEVRRRPRPEDCRLDLMQVERRRGRRNIAAEGFRDRRHGRSFQGSGSIAPGPPANDWPMQLSDLVEQFLDGLADLFEPSGLRRGQVRAVNVPGLGRDLVTGDPIRRRLRITHSWITLAIAQPQIHGIRDLRREVFDVGVKVAVIGRREKQFRVVVHEHEAHVVDRAYRVRRPEVPFQQLQQAAQPLRSTFHERKEHAELRDLALTKTDTAGLLRMRRRCQLLREHGEAVLQRGSAHFRRVGIKLPELLNLLVDRQTLFWPIRCCRLRCHGSFSFRSSSNELLGGGYRAVGRSRCRGHQHRSTDQASVLEIVVCLLRGAERIAVHEDLQPTQGCQAHYLLQRDAAAVQTRHKLRAWWHFEEVEGNRAAARADHGEAAAP